MTYEVEAMSPVEVEVPSHRRIHFNEVNNDEARVNELYLLEERRNTSQVNLAKYNRKMTRYYNSKVKNRTLRLEDLVLGRVFQSSKPTGSGVFGSNWEGPYPIRRESRPGTLEIEDMAGKSPEKILSVMSFCSDPILMLSNKFVSRSDLICNFPILLSTENALVMDNVNTIRESKQ
ncbi:uncharacterized protein LOC111383679 [Olea europaea var. sylvestris]|uniref:uncharacterized protein LOC111383679 n=1 Tax=Olea europaea var. sylvestris TaxID=158386 RepID=UPI000C1D2CE6|nr:uncharacterized protein LOC111383679 [Olea europaea var. sylvestris]